MAEIDMEKAHRKLIDVFTRSVVSLEILRLKELPKNEEEAKRVYEENVKERYYIVDDLPRPYVIKLSYTEDKPKIKSVDPDHLPEIELYELSETIQEILRENDFAVIESEFTIPEKDDIVITETKTDSKKFVAQTPPLRLVTPQKKGKDNDKDG